MTSLRRFEMQNTGITIFNSRTMQNLGNLEEIIFSPYVDFIGAECFINAVKLTKLTLPCVERWIDFNCFKGCTGIITVHFEGFFKFGKHILAGCTSLKTVYYCDDNEPTASNIGDNYIKNMFDGLNVTVYVPITYNSNTFLEVDVTNSKKLNDACEIRIEPTQSPAETITPTPAATIDPLDNITDGTYTYYFNGREVIIEGSGNIQDSMVQDAYTSYKEKHPEVNEKLQILTIIGTGNVAIVSPGFNNNNDIIKINMSQNIGQSNVINSKTLQNMTNLEEFIFPQNIDFLGSYLFMNDVSLTSISIPCPIRWIDYRCFINCTSLRIVHFENGLNQFGYELFEGCKSLESIFYCSTKIPVKSVSTYPDIFIQVMKL